MILVIRLVGCKKKLETFRENNLSWCYCYVAVGEIKIEMFISHCSYTPHDIYLDRYLYMPSFFIQIASNWKWNWYFVMIKSFVCIQQFKPPIITQFIYLFHREKTKFNACDKYISMKSHNGRIFGVSQEKVYTEAQKREWPNVTWNESYEHI